MIFPFCLADIVWTNAPRESDSSFRAKLIYFAQNIIILFVKLGKPADILNKDKIGFFLLSLMRAWDTIDEEKKPIKMEYICVKYQMICLNTLPAFLLLSLLTCGRVWGRSFHTLVPKMSERDRKKNVQIILSISMGKTAFQMKYEIQSRNVFSTSVFWEIGVKYADKRRNRKKNGKEGEEEVIKIQ